MSKDETATNEIFAAATPDADGGLNHKDLAEEATAGTFLRSARLAQGMDIATLAAFLKVPVHKLQALEQGRFENLPDPVFTRALASSMCRILKLDPAPVLQLLPVIKNFKAAAQNRGINAPFRTRDSRHAAPVWSHISRPAIWLGLALLVGTLLLMFLPAIQQEFARLQPAGQTQTSPDQAAPPVSATTTLATPVARNDDAAGAAQNPALLSSAPAEVAVLAPGPATLPVPPALVSTPVAVLQPILSFSATGVSNVKVTDANGTLVLNRLLRAGESAGLSGALPLVAVVSRANAVQVQVRGEAFDLGAVSKNNIARFEVK